MAAFLSNACIHRCGLNVVSMPVFARRHGLWRGAIGPDQWAKQLAATADRSGEAGLRSLARILRRQRPGAR